ncbi:MAG: metal-dependent hydrolase [Candidatus Thorarchaeota archaeon]
MLTHLMIGSSIALTFMNPIDKERTFLIMLGSTIIDIERPLYWLFEFLGVRLIGLTSGFHSIFGALLLSVAGASIFEDTSLTFGWRVRYLLIGATSHLIMDMTMYPWPEQGIPLLFPIRIPFSFNLLWSDSNLYPLVGATVFIFALMIHYVKSRRRQINAYGASNGHNPFLLHHVQ